MDVIDRNSVAKVVEQIIAKQGRIDVVVNNAGIGIGGSAELATEEEIALQMNTNFGGTVNVCSCVLPYMRKQRNGLIINMSSIGGVFGIPYQGFYSASKFAIEGYSETLSLETAPFGIKVVIVEPGDFVRNLQVTENFSRHTKQCRLPRLVCKGAEKHRTRRNARCQT